MNTTAPLGSNEFINNSVNFSILKKKFFFGSAEMLIYRGIIWLVLTFGNQNDQVA